MNFTCLNSPSHEKFFLFFYNDVLKKAVQSYTFSAN